MSELDWFNEIISDSNNNNINSNNKSKSNEDNNTESISIDGINIKITNSDDNKENNSNNNFIINRENNNNVSITFNNFNGILTIQKQIQPSSSSSTTTSSSSRRTSYNWSQHLTVDDESNDRKRDNPFDDTIINSSNKKVSKVINANNVISTPTINTITDNSPTTIEFNTTTNSNRNIARWGHVSASDGENVFIYGGQDENGTLGDVLIWKVPSILNGNDDKIFIMRQLCESRPRMWHSMVHLSEKKLLLVYGGESFNGEINLNGNNKSSEYFDDLLVLDTTLLLWYPPGVSGKGPTARAGHTAGLIHNNKMVIYGGQKNDKYPHNITVLDTERWHWNAYKCDGKPPKARAHHSCCNLSDNTLIYFGGHDGGCSFNDIHLLITNDKGTFWKWEQPEVSGTLPIARAKHTAIIIGPISNNHPYGQYLLVSGGYNYNGELGTTTSTDDTYVLDMSSWVWYKIKEKDLQDASSIIEGIDLLNPSDHAESNTSFNKIGETPIKVVINNKNYISLFGGLTLTHERSNNFILIDELKLLKSI